MSRHPFSRRMRRRVRKGRRILHPTFAVVSRKASGAPDRMKLRWAPFHPDRVPKKPVRTTGGRRYPWDRRRSAVSKRRARTPDEIERWEARKRLEEFLRSS